MSFPRPTIVDHYEDAGTATDRHGKTVKLKSPIYTSGFKGFRHYLAAPKKKGGRFKFPRGTFQKMISEHCRPCEGRIYNLMFTLFLVYFQIMVPI